MVLVLITAYLFGWIVHRSRVKASEAAYQQSKLMREVAEIALVEYIEGVLKQGEANAHQTIEELKVDVEKAKAVELTKKNIYMQMRSSWMSLYW